MCAQVLFFNHLQSPSSFPLLDEIEKSREESTRLLQDFALVRCDERTLVSRIALPSDLVLPSVKPEPETGLSLDVKVEEGKRKSTFVFSHVSKGRRSCGNSEQTLTCRI